MNISVILAHPNKDSFNHAIASTIIETLEQNGHQFWFHDLHAENFDPILPFVNLIKMFPCPQKSNSIVMNSAMLTVLLLYTQTGGDSRRLFSRAGSIE